MAGPLNRKFLSEFIDMYRELPELWKVKSDGYKNKVAKKCAYEKLLVKLKEVEESATMESVKRKLNSLRSSYRRELHKIRQSERSGTGAEDLHEPTLWYFEELSFLRDQEESISAISAMEAVGNEEEANSFECGNESVSRRLGKKRKIQNKAEIRNVILKKAVEHLEHIQTAQNQKDDAAVFSEGWAAVFRKLAPDQQIFAKKAIDEVLFEAQLGNLTAFSARNVGSRTIAPIFHRTSTPSTSRMSNSPLASSSQDFTAEEEQSPVLFSVSSPFNIPPEHGLSPKEEWRKLRDCHRDALRRQRLSVGNVPKQWKYMEKMSFLLPYMGARPRYDMPSIKPLVPATTEDSTPTVHDPTPTPAAPAVTPTPVDPNPAPASAAPTPVVDQHMDEEDDTDSFFEFVCQAAKKLPAKYRKQLREAVSEALRNAENGWEIEECLPPPEAVTLPPPTSPPNFKQEPLWDE